MELQDLTAWHVGQWVTLTHSDWSVAGVLEAYNVEYDVIYDHDLSNPEPVRVLGAKRFVLRVGGWEGTIQDPSRVTVALLQ